MGAKTFQVKGSLARENDGFTIKVTGQDTSRTINLTRDLKLRQ